MYTAKRHRNIIVLFPNRTLFDNSSRVQNLYLQFLFAKCAKYYQFRSKLAFSLLDGLILFLQLMEWFCGLFWLKMHSELVLPKGLIILLEKWQKFANCFQIFSVKTVLKLIGGHIINMCSPNEPKQKRNYFNFVAMVFDKILQTNFVNYDNLQSNDFH